MLLEQFEAWLEGRTPTMENFSTFYYETQGTDYQKSVALAYQIYELQVCVEGLIEELENRNER